ncbi:uncharacterized protein EAF01_007857 [Botrytis porri]|uniref:uncharacterized protein n=1 Tax=Botrytis porri TaxID=87229 RepID=UPI00190094A8|nr:uncharacterized protein EAF01_007857 [Botrytis porri]KAF7900555.1 hypothetical protein EAF01_007857 [Botrytis porri]
MACSINARVQEISLRFNNTTPHDKTKHSTAQHDITAAAQERSKASQGNKYTFQYWIPPLPVPSSHTIRGVSNSMQDPSKCETYGEGSILPSLRCLGTISKHPSLLEN